MVLAPILLAVAAAGRAAGTDAAFERVEARYAREFLRRNPVVSTYLGGAGLDPSLAAADGALRDWSAGALADEARWLTGVRAELERLDPRALSPRHRIDREVAFHQIAFLLHQDQERRYWQRSLDTYVQEAVRGIAWYQQGMADLGHGRLGTEAEWRTVAARVAAVPRYLATARTNLAAGLEAGNTPDWRMVERDGLAASEENARWFEATLPRAAGEATAGAPWSPAVVEALRSSGAAAARAFRELRSFIEVSLATLPRVDRFAVGEAEYDWALHNDLKVPFTAAELWDSSWPRVERTRERLVEAARAVAERHGLPLSFDPGSREASTLAVLAALEDEAPRGDEEMMAWYRDAALRMADFARRHRLFDVPGDYRLDVVVPPPALGIDGAAYYPAPPFRGSGVGRFYVASAGGDRERLKRSCRSSIAVLSAHEGFPGHDWHYKVMTLHRRRISPVRWLTPGEVEGSSSMWQDSMAVEGWGLYAEALMAEPAPGAPGGFYGPEERLFQLRAQLYRDLRVRVDVGLHTGRLSFDDAVDLFSRLTDFQPGSCRDAERSRAKVASCEASARAVYRYTKWPVQAATYRLGMDRLQALRKKAARVAPGAAGLARFHALFMQEGPVAPAYFEEELLAELTRVGPPGGSRGRAARSGGP